MTAYRRLADGLPERAAGDAGSVPTDAKAARIWVAALPLASGAQTSRILREALDKLNGLKIDASRRFAVLEVLREPVVELLGFVERQILGSSFPPPASKAELGRRARSFHEALALGYRMVVVDVCARSERVPFLRGRMVARAIERAMFHQGAALGMSYLLYLKPAPGAWAPLHDLARFAEDVKLAEKAVAEPLIRRDTSPSRMYRQVLLVAVCNPYRFSQREQIELQALCHALAGLCSLGRQPAPGAFVLPEGEDRGPGYLPSERDEAGASGHSFDVSALREQLQRQLDDGRREVVLKGTGGRQVRMPPDMARRCVSAWSSNAGRNHQRLTAGHRLDSIIGLSAMHFFLAGERDFESFMREVHGVGAALAAGDVATWAGTTAEQSRPGVFRARVLDQSLGGYQLAWDKSHAVRARVGELVGLAVPSDGGEERDWMLSIIRWLRYDPDGGLEAGVELLARRARAVGLRLPINSDETRAALRGIEFNHVRGDDESVLHVLAPSILERHGKTIEVTRGTDPRDFDSQSGVTWMHGVQMVEHTGDYLHLAGAVGDNGESPNEPRSS